MTQPHADGVIEQAFFGWSDHSNRLDLVASSFESLTEGQVWSARLKEHLRLQGFGRPGVPSRTLSYLDFKDGWAVVLRRVGDGHSTGRNNSHALIGPAELLTVTTAVGLDEWPGWKSHQPPSKVLGYLTPMDLTSAAGQMVVPPDVESQIEVVLARLIDQPYQPLSIIGCGVPHRLAVVDVLRGAADHYLRHHLGVAKRWSFSTHEVRHDDSVSHLPEIVFLPDRPEGTGVARRTLVDLRPGRVPAALPHLPTARDLVKSFLHGDSAPVEEALSQGAAAPVGVQPPAQETLMPSPFPRVGGHVPQQFPQSAADDRGTGATWSWSRPLAALADAKTISDFHDELRALESSASSRERRAEIRAALDVGTMDRIAGFTTRAAPRELTNALLSVVYGRGLEDLGEEGGMKHATDFVERSTSTEMAAMVATAARPRSENRVLAAVYKRWANDGKPPIIGGTSRPPKSPPVDLRTWAVRAAAVLGVLGVVFLLGFLLGLPSTEPTDDGRSAPAATEEPSTVPKAAALPTVGRATLEPPSTHEVLSFVQVGERFYPQSLCHEAESTSWQCVRQLTPPDGTTPPKLVAIAVPESEVPELLTTGANGQPTSGRTSWGKPVPLSAG